MNCQKSIISSILIILAFFFFNMHLNFKLDNMMASNASLVDIFGAPEGLILWVHVSNYLFSLFGITF